MSKGKGPAVPSGLGNAGRRLWTAILGDLDDDYEFDQREMAILATACRQADTVASLERAVKADGVTIPGAAGQRRLNAAVTELRQGRIALARLLGDLDLPSEADKPTSAASRRASHAAQTRWTRQARVREMRARVST
jgi:hypothetical protein